MSHSVTVTRTTTTASTSAVIINTGYCSSVTGILKIFETILGAICLGLIAYFNRYGDRYYAYSGFFGTKEDALFFIVSFGFLVTTFLLLVACCISLASAAILPKSTFEYLYHLVAFIFYISASLALLIELNRRNEYRQFREYGYEGKMAAAVLGMINSLFYLLSFIFSIRTFRLA